MLRVLNTSDVNDRNTQRLQKVQPNILIFQRSIYFTFTVHFCTRVKSLLNDNLIYVDLITWCVQCQYFF